MGKIKSSPLTKSGRSKQRRKIVRLELERGAVIGSSENEFNSCQHMGQHNLQVQFNIQDGFECISFTNSIQEVIVDTSQDVEIECVLEEAILAGIQLHGMSNNHCVAKSSINTSTKPESTCIEKPSKDISGLLASVQDDFCVKLLRFATKHNISNNCLQDLLTLLRKTQESDLRSLPNKADMLAHMLFSNEISVYIGFVCKTCCSVIKLKYSRDYIKPSCCGHTYDYNDDHFVVIDTFQLLKIHLPHVWKFRDVDFMPPQLIRKYMEQRLSFETDFSLTLNLDGVPIFNSSGTSLWPFFGYVDCLPHKFIKSNILMFGVWVGKCKSKPSFSAVLDTLISDIEHINQNGIEWNCPNVEAKVVSKCIVSKVSCDSMGRPVVQCMQQFNGTYGCGYCTHRGGGSYFIHIDPPSSLRTDSSVRNVARHSALEYLSVDTRQGVLGASIFLKLSNFNIVQDFPPDVMHCVYLGVTKQLTSVWISHKKASSYLGEPNLTTLNTRLSQIKPPFRVSRISKSLHEWKFWKAHQWSMWLLYYSVPILQDLLSPQHFRHWNLLVYSISLLTKPSVSGDDIETARLCLDDFSRDTIKLYGYKQCTFNIHLLRHLPMFCSMWGPLQTFSMGPFENFNMHVKSYVHGSQSVVLQIYKRYIINILVKLVGGKNITQDGNVSEKNRVTDDTGSCSRDSITKLEWELSDFTIPKNCDTSLVETTKCRYYSVLTLQGGRKYHSTAYRKVKKRNSYSVLLKNGNVAKILAYIQSPADLTTYAIIDEYVVATAFNLDHIYIVTSGVGMRLAPVDTFEDLVLHIECDSKFFYCKFVNNVENVNE